jgi:hypothetical protein
VCACATLIDCCYIVCLFLFVVVYILFCLVFCVLEKSLTHFYIHRF